MPDKFAHCTFCGARFTLGQPWPRRCAACGEVSYLNPSPVAVALQPVAGGLLVVRRANPPAEDRLALPGGYIEMDETWQAAAARELGEETGLRSDPSAVRLYDTVSAPDGTLLVIGLFAPAKLDDLPPSTSNDESHGWEILLGPSELGFDIHTTIAARWFDRR
jgi:ADP-ribose pyrophosphatase YjhB (NUDIX family)